MDERYRLLLGDAAAVLSTLPSSSVQMIACSPPYYSLRDYKEEGQIGLEATPLEFVARLVAVFREAKRVLRDDGTLWIVIGDSYNAYNGNRGEAQGLNKTRHECLPSLPSGYGLTTEALPAKSLLGIPWRLAFSLQDDGWILRQDLVWAKGSSMPESVQDRCTRSHEYIFMFSKRPRYYYDATAIAEESAQSRIRKTGVVHSAQRTDDDVVLLNDRGFQQASSIGSVSPPRLAYSRHLFAICVRHATAILDSAGLEDQKRLLPLDTEIGQQGTDDMLRVFTSDRPFDSRATALALRFAAAEIAPKEFLRELNRLGIALADRAYLEVTNGSSHNVSAPCVDTNGDTAIGVDNPSEVSQFKFSIHGEQYNAGVTSSQVTSTRNRRSVWNINAEPFTAASLGITDVDHFAAYPTKLVEPMVLAGSSPMACPVPECGAPWRRVVETGDLAGEARIQRTARPAASERGVSATGLARTNGRTWRERHERGWTPTCSCPENDGSGQCTILDCFTGTSTTGVVALRHGRRFIGVDLNPDYLAISERRLRASLYADNVVEGPRTRPGTGQQELFSDAVTAEPLGDKQGRTGSRTYEGFNARWAEKQKEAIP